VDEDGEVEILFQEKVVGAEESKIVLSFSRKQWTYQSHVNSFIFLGHTVVNG